MKISYVETKEAISVPNQHGARTNSLRADAVAGGDWYSLRHDASFVYAQLRGEGDLIVIPMDNVKQMHAKPEAAKK